VSKRLLHIVSTPRGLASNTGRVSSALLEALDDEYADLDVTTLDLFSADLPAVAGINIKTKYALMTGQPVEEGAQSSWAEIEKTIAGFLDADVYVLTVPMWNFSIPYVLKYYIDAIVQPGYLFRYNQQGQPEGLVHGRRMVVVTSSGADYSEGHLASLNSIEGYLRSIFGMVGITDIKFFSVQPMDRSTETRKAAQKATITDVRAWVADGAWGAPPVIPAQSVASAVPVVAEV
jgi:FMN-dependent NADH-azoreductase